ncbi:hypothetical protein CSKR_111825, partial [Clonorchis sinensis]
PKSVGTKFNSRTTDMFHIGARYSWYEPMGLLDTKIPIPTRVYSRYSITNPIHMKASSSLYALSYSPLIGSLDRIPVRFAYASVCTGSQNFIR